MPLSPKERDHIVEEESLRFETRRNLHAQTPCRRGCGRIWLWCLAFFILGYAVHGLCTRVGSRYCPYEGMGFAPGHCIYGQNGAMPQGGDADSGQSGTPSQAAPAKR
ncbi:MAG: hypothetical protein ACREKE_04845 [bacterium]